MKNIFDCLEKDRAYVESAFPEYDILGVFLYGSQNYNLATEDSDVDTIVVLIPSLRELMLGSSVSKTIELPDHHIVVKDILAFNKNVISLSPMAVEPLFSQYKWVNPKYARMWFDEYEDYREDIALACPSVLYEKVRGMVKSICKKKEMTYKQYVLCQRLICFLWELFGGKDYEEALVVNDQSANYYKSVKARTDLVPDCVKEIVIDRVESSLLEDYFNLNKKDEREAMKLHMASVAALMVKRKENIL